MSKTFKYNGHTGSSEVSIEDNCLYGKILFINDLITYEANTVPELKKAFEESVDDYLETCKEIGKDPDKSFTGSFNVRLGSQSHKIAALTAFEKEQTLNEYVRAAVDEKNDRENHTSLADLLMGQNLLGEIEKNFFTTDYDMEKNEWEIQPSISAPH